MAQTNKPAQRTCFVIMPFSQTATHTEKEWTEVFEDLFKPTMEVMGFECLRSRASVGSILRGIIQSLSTSALVLADLTDAKTNVFYELGIAHTMTNRVIMVSQNPAEVPSDLRAYGVIKYGGSAASGGRFTKDLTQAVRRVFTESTPASPVQEYLGTTLSELQAKLAHPIAILECSKCHKRYNVAVGQMGHGDGDIQMYCQHWEPSIFRGLWEPPQQPHVRHVTSDI